MTMVAGHDCFYSLAQTMLRAGLCQSTYPRGAEMQSGRFGWSFAYRSADNELHGVVPRGMEGLLFLGGRNHAQNGKGL
jgi:hypothetical protein